MVKSTIKNPKKQTKPQLLLQPYFAWMQRSETPDGRDYGEDEGDDKAVNAPCQAQRSSAATCLAAVAAVPLDVQSGP